MNRTLLIGCLASGAIAASEAREFVPNLFPQIESPRQTDFALPPILIDPGAVVGDPAAVASDAVDTSFAWAAYDAGDFSAVRAAIAGLVAANPGWTPPQDLIRLTDAGENRRIVMGAAQAQQWDRIVAHYRAHPQRFACADINIEALWTVAEAFAALGDTGAAFGIHARVVDECEETDLRLASLEKAIALRDNDLFAALIAVEEERVHEGDDLERLQRIRRDGLGEAIAPQSTGPVELSRFDRTLQAVGAGRASAQDLAWLERATRDAANANAAMVIGYHYLNGGDAPAAASWFEQSLAWRRNRKAAEGLYYALGRMGRDAERARLVAAYPDVLEQLASVETAGNGNASLAPAWDALNSGHADRAVALAATLPGATPGERALLQGWALLSQNEARAAAAAFAAAGNAGSADVQASARKGQAMALIASDRADEVKLDSITSTEDRKAVEQAAYDRRIISAYERGDAAEALSLLKARDRAFPGAPPLGLIEGWILYANNRLLQADVFFRNAVRSGPGPVREEAKIALQTVSERMYGYD